VSHCVISQKPQKGPCSIREPQENHRMSEGGPHMFPSYAFQSLGTYPSGFNIPLSIFIEQSQCSFIRVLVVFINLRTVYQRV
jgi:hypothetical protein